MIYIHKEGCTHKVVIRRNEQDIQKEVINIPIRSLLESITHGLIFFCYTKMNFQLTKIKDITTSNTTSSLGCFEKGNKYHMNDSRNLCHGAT